MACSISLTVLNDDCLDRLFKYLSFADLLPMFGEFDPRIDEAIERQLNRFRHFQASMRFPPKYNKKQLQAHGRHIVSVNINVGFTVAASDTLSILRPLFTGAAETGRLRAVKIQHATFTSGYVNALKLVAPFLHLLDLSHCDVDNVYQLTQLLRSCTQLKTLALYNKDALDLEEPLLNRLCCLKINWLMGSTFLDVDSISNSYPNLHIIVYNLDEVKKYGPEADESIDYFRD